MPERKYDRPSDLETIRLPGPTRSDVDGARDEFARHIRDGLAAGRFAAGDVLPTLAEVRRHYGLPEEHVRRAIRELRRTEHLHLHDDYLDTYVLDPGPDHPPGAPREDLAVRVARLEAMYDELAARVAAIEARPPRP
ncbi:GntR family transcriptional regulator [Streptomyces sp. NPDC003635]